MPSSSGVMFGRYRLLEQIGSGGMALVFRAVVDGPKGFTRELVIKRIRPERCQNQHFVNMLASEARLCALLRHPGIVQVNEFGEVAGEYYLAMELVEGNDLGGVLRALSRSGRRLPMGLACHIINELAGALAYAHALTDGNGRPLDIVHRDVSPSNIMIGALGTVKLLDFGIAKAAAHVREERTETETGALKGKIAYMSPQQADGLPIDSRSDIFALGVVFYELLTQRRLFRGDSELERLRLVREARVSAPSSVLRGIDPAIDAVVLKMLAREPQARYQTGDEVVAALTPLVHGHMGHTGALRQLIAELRPFFAPRPPGLLDSDGVRSAPEAAPVKEPPRLAPPLPGQTMTSSRGELQPRPQPSLARRWVPVVATCGLVLLGVSAAVRLRDGTTTVTRPSAPLATAAAPAPPTELTAPVLAPVSPAAPEPTAAPATAASATAAHAASPRRRVERVHLRIAGPAGADVYVDGRLVGELPLDVALPFASAARHVLVRRSGHAPWSRKIAGDTNVSLTAKWPPRRRDGGSSLRPDSEDARVYDPFSHH